MEVGSRDEVKRIERKRSVILREDDAGGRAIVTRDEERVLRGC